MGLQHGGRVVDSSKPLPLLKLALAALERDVPNVDLARGLLREVVGDVQLPIERSAHAEPQFQRAVTIKRASEILSLSTKTIRKKIARGEIPAIGSGRTTRVLMPDAINALAQGTNARHTAPKTDPIADEAVALVRARERRVKDRGPCRPK